MLFRHPLASRAYTGSNSPGRTVVAPREERPRMDVQGRGVPHPDQRHDQEAARGADHLRAGSANAHYAALGLKPGGLSAREACAPAR
jgi:hypothetical protein